MTPFRQVSAENRDLMGIKQNLIQFLRPRPVVNFMKSSAVVGPFNRQ